MIAVDTSSKGTYDMYAAAMKFVSKLSYKLKENPGNRLAVITYETSVHIKFPLNHNLTQNQTRDYTKPISKSLWPTKLRKANAHLAINEALNQFEKYPRPGVPKIILFVMHGEISDWTETQYSCTRALNSGMQIFAVGTDKTAQPWALFHVTFWVQNAVFVNSLARLPTFMKEVSKLICS